MSRSGYTDDNDDPLARGRWRAQVKSAIRGKRGQSFLQELATAMDAMPVKELIANQLIDAEGACCTIGVVCKSRGIDVSKVDPHEPWDVGRAVGIAHQMAQEIEYCNDEYGYSFEKVKGKNRWERVEETPEQRWQRMRKWVSDRLVKSLEEPC